nr:unnamed protein product [Spirometra erinaceieuropaei]
MSAIKQSSRHVQRSLMKGGAVNLHRWRRNLVKEIMDIVLSISSVDQPDKLGRPRLAQIYVENRENRRSNLRSQPHHRSQSQTRETGKSQLQPPPPPLLPPTCPRCQRTFPAPIGLVINLLINCSTRIAPTVVSPSTSNVDRPPEPPLSSCSSCSSSSSSSASSTDPTSADVVSAMPINTTHNPDTPTNTTTTINTSN